MEEIETKKIQQFEWRGQKRVDTINKNKADMQKRNNKPCFAIILTLLTNIQSIRRNNNVKQVLEDKNQRR